MHVVSLEAATDVIKSLSIFLVIFWFLQKISLRREFNRQLGEYYLLHVFLPRETRFLEKQPSRANRFERD